MTSPVESLRALLYTLLRDDVVAGRMEALVLDLEKHPGPFTFSNEHLSGYARELALRVLLLGPEKHVLAVFAVREHCTSCEEDAPASAPVEDECEKCGRNGCMTTLYGVAGMPPVNRLRFYELEEMAETIERTP